MAYIDLRDLTDPDNCTCQENDEGEKDTSIDLCDECTEALAWRTAIKDSGYSFGELAQNDPVMIPEDEFEDYAQELAEDIGAIDRHATWPLACIDWERAANELKADYSVVEVDGVTYYFRSY